MKPLKPIEDSYTSVLDLCSSTYKKNDLKQRFEHVSKHTKNMDSLYKQHATQTTLFQFPKKQLSKYGVSDKEFEDIYNDKLVAKNASGRDVYMRIKNLCTIHQNRCPSCARREVSTLDHFLPKSIFPELSISPLNLIPNCLECNKSKLTYVANNSESELIHPYFDNIDSEKWLFAKLIGEKEMVVEYFVKKPESWSETLFKRVRNHINIYELDLLFSSNAINLLHNHKQAFKNLRNQKNGVSVLKEHILLLYNSFNENNLNSFETALFYALIDNDEFYESNFCV